METATSEVEETAQVATVEAQDWAALAERKVKEVGVAKADVAERR